MHPPTLLRTERLTLRPWRVSDAPALGAILDVNYEHLGLWIPPRIANPASPAELATRIQKFADDFATASEWRYALLTADEAMLLGEISLFPRSPTARVPYADSDRIEVGYWIRKDATGKGFVTEAVCAVVEMVAKDPRFSCVEIRCDARNAPSNAVPVRLGFKLAGTITDGDLSLRIWATATTSTTV